MRTQDGKEGRANALRTVVGNLAGKGKDRGGTQAPLTLTEEIAELRLTSRHMATLVAVLIFIALAAVAWAGYTFAQAQTQRATLLENVVPTVVATGDIAKGTTIDESMLEVRNIPAGYHVSAAEGTPAALLGQQAAEDISAGTQLTRAMVAGAANTAYLATCVQSGRNVVTLSTDAESGQSGALRVGDRVRVMATGTADAAADFSKSAQEASGGLVVFDLLSSARICALDGDPAGSKAYSTVSLDLSPSDAARVTLAQNAGLTLDFALLPAIDAERG